MDYIDWSQARSVVFPNLRPSATTISLRPPAHLLADLKALANERDVPYQPLLKVFLADQVRREQGLRIALWAAGCKCSNASESPIARKKRRAMLHSTHAVLLKQSLAA